MADPYKFKSDNSPGDPNVTYRFITDNGIEYAISFLEVTKIIDLLDQLATLSNAVYLSVDITAGDESKEDKVTGVTISDIVKDYESLWPHSIFIFNCQENDGRQYSRHRKFSIWFKVHCKEMNFEKHDKEILETDNGAVYIASYISILFSNNDPRRHRILEELVLFKKILDGQATK